MKNSLLLISLTCALPAAELRIDDLRIEVGQGEISGMEAEIEFQQSSVPGFSNQSFVVELEPEDDPLFISAMWSRGRLDPWGFVWAVGAEWQHAETSSLDDMQTELFGLTGRAGLGWTPAERWRVEAGGEAQVGVLYSEMRYTTSTESYQAIGAHLGIGYRFASSPLEVGLSLRAMAYQGEFDGELGNGDRYDGYLTWYFTSAAVTLGYRF
jgi:hypothetical protein